MTACATPLYLFHKKLPAFKDRKEFGLYSVLVDLRTDWGEAEWLQYNQAPALIPF